MTRRRPHPHRTRHDAQTTQSMRSESETTRVRIKSSEESGSSSSRGARTRSSRLDIAAELGSELVPTDARTFANGEIYARFDESVRGCDAFVIQSHTAPINEWLMEQLIMVDALKRASAKRITVVAPFYPYARQDKKGRGREPISARLVADLFKAAGADRIMCVDLHAAQIQGFFDGPVDHLFAMPVLLEHFQREARPVDPHRRLARHGPRARRRHLERQARRAAGHHPQAPRPAGAQPGHRCTRSSARSRAASACSSTT